MKEYICEFRCFDGSFFRFVALGERALTEALMFARDDDRFVDFSVHKVSDESINGDWSDF